ncbi:MAG: hypothetical protein M1830_002045, partial [Pleopsidium flavum]
MGNIWSQSYFIPAPPLTEQNVPDLTGKVFIVTGANSGCGFELAKLTYQKNGSVYVAGRSPERCGSAIEKIKTEFSTSSGTLVFLKLDLGDLTTIKKSAEEFLGKEQRLDVLWNNAGVMVPPKGSVTAQGHELQIGTNCLGHFLFTQLLYPTLKRTAATSPANTVRVAWAGSLAIDVSTPNGGVDFDEKGDIKYTGQQSQYGVSKAGNLFLASEFGKRTQGEGIVSVAFNPGNLKSELQKHMPAYQRVFLYTFSQNGLTQAWAPTGLRNDLPRKRVGPYAPAILRFQISFPPNYPDLPPIVTFTTDIFHPLLTPLTTYTYSTGSSNTDPVSATDEERLPPGGFSLRHGFPDWFQRAKRSAANSPTSSRNVSGSDESHSQQLQPASLTRTRNPIPSDLGVSLRASPSPAGRSPQIRTIAARTKKDITIVEVLRYIRSAFDEDTVLDSLPLEAAGNPGAWYAWRAHRRQTPQQRPPSLPKQNPNEHFNDNHNEAATRGDYQSSTGNISTGHARRPGEWNWEGVWEERVRRGVEG